MMKFTSGAASNGLRSLVQEIDSIVSHFSDAIDDGFQFSDVISTIGKVVGDLSRKFIAFDGIGSILAGGALVGGLIKVYQLTQKVRSGLSSFNDVINSARGFKSDLPTKSSTGASASSVKSMVVNATSVVVNGKSVGGANSKSTGASPILGPNGKLLPPAQTSIPKTPAPKSFLGNLGDGAKWLGSHAKGLGGAMLGIGALTGAYDIYNAEEGQRAETAGSVAGSLGGGLAGAKAGALVGGAIGSAVPVVGTAVGAGVGGIVGGIGGSLLGDSVGSSIGASLGNINLDGVKDSVGNTLEWMKNGFANNVEFIGNIFSELGNSIGASLSGAVSSIGDVLSSIGESIYNWILAPIGNLGIDIMNIIVGAFAMLWELISPGLEAIGEGIFNNLIQPLIDGFNSMMEFIQEIWNGITDSINTSLIEPITSNIYIIGYNIAEKFNEASALIQSAWSIVANWFDSSVWQPIVSGVTYVANGISSLFSACWSIVQSLWSMAVGFFSGIYNSISNAARSACSAISSAFSSAVSAVKSAWDGIVGWFTSNIFEPIASKVRSVMSFVNTVRNVGVSVTGVESNLGHNATGTTYWEGGLTEINERGGEIVDLPTGSRIYPAQTTQRIIENQIKESNTPTNAPIITITGNNFTVREEADIDRIAHELFNLFNQSSLNYGGGY